jgi:membrane protein implicated in regulation of membrane protease activity
MDDPFKWLIAGGILYVLLKLLGVLFLIWLIVVLLNWLF